MSLVSNLISGSTGNFGLIDPKKYGHDTGALRIATESAEALHDIFIESFYNMEQAELAAVHEGVALEGSQYEALTEASVSSVFAKVKEFFKKLWEKVKAFFHNVKRYIDAMFMSGKDFVKKYSADIKKATNLKGFEYKMYDYANDKINNVTNKEGFYRVVSDVLLSCTDNKSDSLVAWVGYVANTIGSYKGKDKYDISDNTIDSSKKATVAYLRNEDKDKKLASEINEYENDYVDKNDIISISNATIDEDNIAVTVARALGIKGVSEYSDFAQCCFQHFRNDAAGKNDMEEIEISSLTEYASIISNINMNNFSKMQAGSDKYYKDSLKAIDDADRLVAKAKDGELKKAISKILSTASSVTSHTQSLINTYISAWKTAAKERDSAYKSMIIKGIAYSKKQGKNK